MAVVGSRLTIDIHFTADTDAGSVRGAMRQNRNIHPQVADELKRMVDQRTAEFFREKDVAEVVASIDFELIDDRVPGAPRERIIGEFSVEGDESNLAGVADAIGPPARADIADAAEELIIDYIHRQNLDEDLNITVSMTPIEFK